MTVRADRFDVWIAVLGDDLGADTDPPESHQSDGDDRLLADH